MECRVHASSPFGHFSRNYEIRLMDSFSVGLSSFRSRVSVGSCSAEQFSSILRRSNHFLKVSRAPHDIISTAFFS
jgi:hypothetical protein